MSRRLPRSLLLALALALFGQSALAAAHCLRLASAPGPASLQVEICTAEGLVVMELGAGHEAPAGHDHAGFCLACHGLPQLLLPEPAGLGGPLAFPIALRFTAPEATPPLGPRAPPYAPRGPPAFS